jgi:hypothetical protein
MNNIHNFRLFFFTLTQIVFFTLNGQTNYNTRNVTGSCYVQGNLSPDDAKKNAINDAKLNALLKFGISEHISSYKILYKQQTNNNFEQVFNSQLLSELSGNIVSYQITKERFYCKNDFEIIYEVTIDAEIIKYKTSLDNKYQVNISGIKGIYTDGEDFGFNLKTTHDCYLTIFDLLDTTAYLVYPQTDKSLQINKNSLIKFPFEGSLDTKLSDSKSSQENHRLLCVMTKEFYPFIIHNEFFSSYENVLTWINSIEPYNRNVQYYPFVIVAE